MSSKDLKTRLESQFCRMNCQMFSWPLSSGARGRQWHQRHVAWDLQHFRAMPTGLIEQDDRVCTRGDLGCDLVEMELHGFAVASRQHEGGASPAFGADRTEQVGRFGPLIVRGAGTGALP